MKRSRINAAIRHAKRSLEQIRFRLPDFAEWSPEEWRRNKPSAGTIFKTLQGWDVTDFGSGNFEKIGAVLFTLRNGCVNEPGTGTPYAEKIIVLLHETEQEIPWHYHMRKTEDIINRGGGILAMELAHAAENGELDRSRPVDVYCDGILRSIKPGEIVEVTPGNSVTLRPGICHRFWARKGFGDVVAGEVSTVNDDKTDNYFLEKASRFAEIEEDEAPLHPLVHEYARFL